MHYVAEVVIPPAKGNLSKHVENSVKQVMESFFDQDDEEEKEGHCDWWDFFVIGGRWSGHKVRATLDPKKLEWFHAELNRRNVTVSGVTCGKQRLEPVSQVPMVDALWRETFPGKGDQCWIFDHARDQYGRKGVYMDDVCTVAETPEFLTCCRLIVAKPHWQHKTKLEAGRMIATEYWNRVEHQKTDFDGKVRPALLKMLEEKKDPDFYKMQGIDLADDWLVVTVDYHN